MSEKPSVFATPLLYVEWLEARVKELEEEVERLNGLLDAASAAVEDE